MTETDEVKALARVIDQLAQRFPSVSRGEIALIVNGEYHEFDGAPVRDYVPVMVERGAKHSLELVAGPAVARPIAA
jgi:hypothetical protein